MWGLCVEPFEESLWVLSKYNPELGFKKFSPSPEISFTVLEEIA